jgi:hypothetical protein
MSTLQVQPSLITCQPSLQALDIGGHVTQTLLDDCKSLAGEIAFRHHMIFPETTLIPEPTYLANTGKLDAVDRH